MDNLSFKALQTAEIEPGKFETREVTRTVDELPPGDLLIKVRYSSLNYKDALSASGNRAVTRQYPHTPGIDAVGDVVSSSDSRFAIGAAVIVTGYDLGMNTAGGLAHYIRVPASWAVPLPAGLGYFEAMVLGTAGFTAALCIDKLLRMGASPEQGNVLVTGATGGVGCCAVALLSQLGFSVSASTGKTINHDFLKRIGATEIIARETLTSPSTKPLDKPQWANAVDTVGGNTLGNVLKAVRYGGSVACCGLVESSTLNTTVLPFILRNVNLLGIDSVELPVEIKSAIWQRLATDMKPAQLLLLANTIGMEQVADFLARFLQGGITGRVVVRIAP
jgi:acrylyl-CoA reductase (NADPH)